MPAAVCASDQDENGRRPRSLASAPAAGALLSRFVRLPPLVAVLQLAEDVLHRDPGRLGRRRRRGSLLATGVAGAAGAGGTACRARVRVGPPLFSPPSLASELDRSPVAPKLQSLALSRL